MERLVIPFNVLSDGHKKTKTLAGLVGLKVSVACDEKFDHDDFTKDFHISAQSNIGKIEEEYFNTFNDKNKLDGYIRTLYARPDKVGTFGSIRILFHVKKNETVVLWFHKLVINGNASLKTIAKTIRDDININVKKDKGGLLFCMDRRDVKYILEKEYKPVLSEDEKIVKKALGDLGSIIDYLQVSVNKDKKENDAKSSTKKTSGKVKSKRRLK